MFCEEIKIGDVLECMMPYVEHADLCEVVSIAETEKPFLILALVSRNLFGTSGASLSFSSVKAACNYWNFPYPEKELEREKLLQHGFYPLYRRELLRKTDQIW